MSYKTFEIVGDKVVLSTPPIKFVEHKEIFINPSLTGLGYSYNKALKHYPMLLDEEQEDELNNINLDDLEYGSDLIDILEID